MNRLSDHLRSALLALCLLACGIARAIAAEAPSSGQDSAEGAPPGAPTRIGDQTFRIFGLSAPGYTWGQVRFPSSLQNEERHNLIVEGEVFQSIEKPLSDNLFIGPIADLYYMKDSKRFDYYNGIDIAVGGQIRWQPLDWISISLGGREEWDFKPVSHRQDSEFIGLLTWYAFRRLPVDQPQNTMFSPKAYLLLAQGLVRYPSSHELKERNNTIIAGAFEGSADLSTKLPKLLVNTFVGINYKADAERFDYNNWVTPGLGAKLKIAASDHVLFEIGAKIAAEYRWISERTRIGPVVFVNWSADW